MKSRFYRSAAAICTVLAFALSAGAGQNASAKVVLGAYGTGAMCSADGMGSTVRVVVKVADAQDLTGFSVRIGFDNTVLKFAKADVVDSGSGAKPFLETNGGQPGPLLVKAVGVNAVDVTFGVKSAEGASVSGDGVLEYVTFTRIGEGDCGVAVVKAQLSDSRLSIDTVVGK